MTASKADPLVIAGRTIQPGTCERFDLPMPRLPTHTPLHIPLSVSNATLAGPVMWLSAAVHGDELNGVEIIRRVLDLIEGKLLKGAVIAAPIVNVFGFIGQSRYLPDRRDLNRSFPGSSKGSLASRIAHLFRTEIVAQSTHGLDLHTGSQDRSNLPQVRGNLEDPETLRMAQAFVAPAMIHSPVRSGSLRGAAAAAGAAVLVYEGGEAQRFNEKAISAGVVGVLGVLQELGMLKGRRKKPQRPSVRITRSSWLRARRGGILRLAADEGDIVQPGQEIGFVADPFGDGLTVLRAQHRGLIIGRTQNPVVHAGDAVVHIGEWDREADQEPR